MFVHTVMSDRGHDGRDVGSALLNEAERRASPDQPSVPCMPQIALFTVPSRLSITRISCRPLMEQLVLLEGRAQMWAGKVA